MQQLESRLGYSPAVELESPRSYSQLELGTSVLYSGLPVGGLLPSHSFERQTSLNEFRGGGSGLPLSGKGDLYFREIPSIEDQLHVHVDDLGKVKWAKLKSLDKPLTNYAASILDLLGEIEGGKKGGKKW